MKGRVLLSFALVFSAFVFSLSSNLQKAEGSERGAKCAILTVKNAFRSSKAVFSGEVIGEETSGDIKTFKFKVEKYWKGENRKEIEISVYQTVRYQSPFAEGENFSFTPRLTRTET